MPDGNFLGIAEASEWFCFNDLIQTQIQSQQNYTVYPYLAYGFVAWHLLFARITWPKIVFPTQSFEVSRKILNFLLLLLLFLVRVNIKIFCCF